MPMTALAEHPAAKRRDNLLVEVDGVPYTWSANGNLLDDRLRAYEYDHADRLIAVSDQRSDFGFAYNGLGDRLVQTVDGVPTQYTLDLNAGLTQVLADGTNTYLYGLTRIGQQGPSGWAYHLPDAMGSVRQMANPGANVALARAYEPYGSVLEVAGEARTRYGFAGEWTDPTGLVHLRARYYAPYFGAFIQPDPWPGSAMTPDTLHPYLYVGGNPVVYRDPSGRCYRALEWMRGIPGEDTLCEYMDMSSFVLGAPMATPAEKALAGTYILGWATAHSLLAVGAGLYTAGTAVAAAEIAPAISSWTAQALAGQMAAGEAATLIAWTAATSELATSLGIGAELYLTYQALACGNPEAAGLLFSGFTLTGQSLVQNGLRRAADRLSRDLPSIISEARTLLSGSDPDFFVTPGGAIISRRLLQLQGLSSRAGSFVGLEGESVEEWVARVPEDWTWEPMIREKFSSGIKFISPDGLREVRIHSPTTKPWMVQNYPQEPGVLEWVGRLGVYFPNFHNPSMVDPEGFIYLDNFGNIGSWKGTETHIPLGGNPYLEMR